MGRSTETTSPGTWSFRNRRADDTGGTRSAPVGAHEGGAPERPDERGQRDVRREPYEGSGIALGVVVLLLAAACIVLVVAQNTESVRFEFLWWDANISLAALLLATGLVVAVLEEIVGLAWRRRRRTMRTLANRS